jgi:conjugal transfer pilus assembly protein TraE
MDKKTFVAKRDSVLAQNNTFRFALMIVSVLALGEGGIIGWLTSTQRTVFMPPVTLTKEFWIEGNAVSKTYLDMVIGHIAETMLNLTPENAEKSMSSVLPLVKPSFYQEYKKQIAKQAAYLVENTITQTFYLQNIDYSRNGVADVQGILSSIVGDKVISTKQIHFKVTYHVSGGKFEVLNISLKDNQQQMDEDMKVEESR